MSFFSEGSPAPRAGVRHAAIPLSFLFVIAGSAAFLTSAQAQPVPAAPLPSVVVTAARTPTRIDETLADVTVIDRAEIEQATGRTLPELLAQQPGVQFASNGGLGKLSSVFLRGLESRHTLLLIDGVRYGSATVGIPIWENLPLDEIERIEIVRGPLSGLYGSDAVGGVIQIFTRRGTEGLRANASLSAGSDRYGQGSAGLRFGAGAIDGAVQLSQTRTRGFSSANPRAQFGSFNDDDDGFRQNAGSVQLGLALGAGWRADLRALQSEGKTEFDDGPGVNSRAELRAAVQSLTVGGPITDDWRSLVRISRSRDDFDTIASASPFAGLGTTRTVQRQLSWENTVATRIGSALLLAERIEQDVSRPGDPYVVSDRSINGVAAGLNGKAGVHTWQGNLRHDRNSQFGSQTTGSLGYGVDITPALRAGFSYGTSFVAPSFNQLYFPNFGSPDLLPEEGRHRELSLRWAGAGHELRAAYFANRIDGYVTPGPNPSNTDARIDGFSLGYDAHVGRWHVAASAELLDPRNDSRSSPNFTKQLPRRAKESLKASAEVDLGAWQLGGRLAAFGQRFDDQANTLPLGGYGLADLYADWRFSREWTLGVRLNNVADKSYETAYGFNQPGRQGFVTLRYSGQ